RPHAEIVKEIIAQSRLSRTVDRLPGNVINIGSVRITHSVHELNIAISHDPGISRLDEGGQLFRPTPRGGSTVWPAERIGDEVHRWPGLIGDILLSEVAD